MDTLSKTTISELDGLVSSSSSFNEALSMLRSVPTNIRFGVMSANTNGHIARCADCYSLIAKAIGDEDHRLFNWFNTNFMADFTSNARTHEIIYAERTTPDKSQIIGVALLRKTNSEREICAIFIDPAWRNKGYGTMLMDLAFIWLETSRPLIIIPERVDTICTFAHYRVAYRWNETGCLPAESYDGKHRGIIYNGR